MASRTEAAQKAWQTRRIRNAFAKARAAEAASKQALQDYCQAQGWRVAFFEGPSGGPRTGIVDAVAFRLQRKNADEIVICLIQLKGGKAGVTAREIGRLKHAASIATVRWLIAAFDGEALHLLPSDLDG